MVKINTQLFSDMDVNDVFFDDLKTFYPDFADWFQRKSEQEAYAYTAYYEGTLVGFLYVKAEENENDDTIVPVLSYSNWLKIGTFKVSHCNQGIGSQFMNIVQEKAKEKHVQGVYVTLFTETTEQQNLQRFLEKRGFFHHGYKNKEHVYIYFL